MTEPIRTLAGLNERNREFWERQNILMNERVGYPFILEKAMRTINAESESRLATRSKKSFVRALEDAANEFKASETPLGRIFAIRGGKASKMDALSKIIVDVAENKPHVTRLQLLDYLKKRQGDGIIIDVDEDRISFPSRTGQIKDASIRGLKDRLSRAKKKIQSR
jgi:hypothetical protein